MELYGLAWVDDNEYSGRVVAITMVTLFYLRVSLVYVMCRPSSLSPMSGMATGGKFVTSMDTDNCIEIRPFEKQSNVPRRQSTQHVNVLLRQSCRP